MQFARLAWSFLLFAGFAAGRTAAMMPAAFPAEDDAAIAGEWDYEFPVPGMSWEEGAEDVIHKLRHPYFRLFAIRGPEPLKEGGRVIRVEDAVLMLDTPCALDMRFGNGHLRQVILRFHKAPSCERVVAWITAHFGKPREVVRSPDAKANRVMRADWDAVICGGTTAIALRCRAHAVELRYDWLGRAPRRPKP